MPKTPTPLPPLSKWKKRTFDGSHAGIGIQVTYTLGNAQIQDEEGSKDWTVTFRTKQTKHGHWYGGKDLTPADVPGMAHLFKGINMSPTQAQMDASAAKLGMKGAVAPPPNYMYYLPSAGAARKVANAYLALHPEAFKAPKPKKMVFYEVYGSKKGKKLATVPHAGHVQKQLKTTFKKIAGALADIPPLYKWQKTQSPMPGPSGGVRTVYRLGDIYIRDEGAGSEMWSVSVSKKKPALKPHDVPGMEHFFLPGTGGYLKSAKDARKVAKAYLALHPDFFLPSSFAGKKKYPVGTSKGSVVYLKIHGGGDTSSPLFAGLDSKGRGKFTLPAPEGKTARDVAREIKKAAKAGQTVLGGKVYAIRLKDGKTGKVYDYWTAK